MRDRVIALLLSVLLGGFALPDADTSDDTLDFDAAPERQLAANFGSLVVPSDEVVLDDEQLRIERTELAPVPVEPRDNTEPPTPTYWTVTHHGSSSLAAGLWPKNVDHAHLALVSTGDTFATAADVDTLLRIVLDHCRDRGYLKLTVHTPPELQAAVAAIDGAGFFLNRTRTRHGTHVVEFYRNLYWQPPRASA